MRLGYYERDFDASGRNKADGFSWDARISYRPRSYSEFLFRTQRVSRETNGLGDFIDSREVAVEWRHDYDSRKRSILKFMAAEDDYSSAHRKDDRYEVLASFVMQLRRWVDLSLSYRYEERDSNQRFPSGKDYLNYDSNSFIVTLDMSL